MFFISHHAEGTGREILKHPPQPSVRSVVCVALAVVSPDSRCPHSVVTHIGCVTRDQMVPGLNPVWVGCCGVDIYQWCLTGLTKAWWCTCYQWIAKFSWSCFSLIKSVTYLMREHLCRNTFIFFDSKVSPDQTTVYMYIWIKSFSQIYFLSKLYLLFLKIWDYSSWNCHDFLLQHLPDQRHSYFLHPWPGGTDPEGAVVSEIPFTHPTHVAAILNYLRQQVLFNTLVASCVRNASLSSEYLS